MIVASDDDHAERVATLAVGHGFEVARAASAEAVGGQETDLPQAIVVDLRMTETDGVDALDILTRLRMLGFQLSMDDFGTGYSTMSQLNELPFNESKMDPRFTRNAARDREARAIVETSIDLGHQPGMRVVAEVIEKQADWDLISGLGCDEGQGYFGQGYFIARPMSGDQLPSWLGHWKARLGRA